MFCPGCGTENPAEAAFCLKCGSNLAQFGGGQGFFARPPAGVPQVPAPPAPMSYLWGYIQGWGMLVGCPPFFLLFLQVLMDPKSDSDMRVAAGVFMGLMALAALTGFGLVRKMKMGMILVFVWAGLHVWLVGLFLLAILGESKDPRFPIALVVALVGLAFWIVCSVYYYRRRHNLR